MHDACTWLLELRLPLTARQAFVVSQESERLAVKKAQVNASKRLPVGKLCYTLTRPRLCAQSTRLEFKDYRALSLSLSETSENIEDSRRDLQKHRKPLIL